MGLITVRNVVFSSLNHVDAADLSTDVAEIASLPLANLQLTAIRKAYRVNAAAVTIGIDYGRDVDIGCVAFAQPDRKPRLRAGDPYRLLADIVRHRLDADGGVPGAGAAYDSGEIACGVTARFGTHFHLLPAPVAARYQTISITASALE